MITRRTFLNGIAGAMAALSLSSIVGCGQAEIPAPAPRNDYTMALVVLKPNYNACDRQVEGTLETAQVLAQEFPAKFNEATDGKVTIDIDPKIYQLPWEAGSITGWAEMEPAISRFNKNYNSDDRFDFVTLINGAQQSEGARHINIFNTSDRVDNSAHPEYSESIGSRRMIGVTSLGTVYSTTAACGDYPELLSMDETMQALFHETAHQWAAFVEGRDYTYNSDENMDEEGFQRKGHYTSRLADLVDVLHYGIYAPAEPTENGIWWESIGEGMYKFHRPEQEFDTILEDRMQKERPYSDLTLWAMGALDTLSSSHLYIEMDFAVDRFNMPVSGTIVKGEMVESKEIVKGK